MILIFGGTTEGRIAVQVAEEAEKPFIYSTFGPEQEIELVNGRRHIGPMEPGNMIDCIRKNNVQLIIDAAHPFAKNLHKNIEEVAITTQLNVIRLERNYAEKKQNNPNIIYTTGYPEALAYLLKEGEKQVLFLTGLHTIPHFKEYWEKYPERCTFRVLDRDSSRNEACGYGIKPDRLIFFNNETQDEDLNRLPVPDIIVSKESGSSGYFENKIKFADAAGAKLLVVSRPTLPKEWTEVFGPYGLRLAIDRLYPDFFDLHCGYTTGSCATAATKAAMMTLCGLTVNEKVSIKLPNGEPIEIPVKEIRKEGDRCSATVIKVSGDDPDVTNGEEIISSVRFIQEEGIHFKAGKGVGTITLPGLGLPVGGPAINKVPKEMMTAEVTGLLKEHPHTGGVEITVSVPSGEELANKTFNPRLGVVGGISIIGTSGIVKPFSHEAFVSSIKKEMQVALALGEKQIILNSGARSEKTMKELFPQALTNAFVHYGNYIGETLALASELDVKEVSMGLMIGKAVKLAEGYADTHSRKVQMNLEFIKQLAHESLCPSETIGRIDKLVMARELLELIPLSDPFYNTLLSHCMDVCRQFYPHGTLNLYLIHDKGQVIARQTNSQT